MKVVKEGIFRFLVDSKIYKEGKVECVGSFRFDVCESCNGIKRRCDKNNGKKKHLTKK